ncbi:MAG: hypothetical protein ACK58T_44860, partial [Phycisphaerae bacterium]
MAELLDLHCARPQVEIPSCHNVCKPVYLGTGGATLITSVELLTRSLSGVILKVGAFALRRESLNSRCED